MKCRYKCNIDNIDRYSCMYMIKTIKTSNFLTVILYIFFLFDTLIKIKFHGVPHPYQICGLGMVVSQRLNLFVAPHIPTNSQYATLNTHSMKQFRTDALKRILQKPYFPFYSVYSYKANMITIK